MYVYIYREKIVRIYDNIWLPHSMKKYYIGSHVDYYSMRLFYSRVLTDHYRGIVRIIFH